MNTLDYLKEKGDKLKKGAKKAVLGGAVAASVLAGASNAIGCGILNPYKQLEITYDDNTTSEEIFNQIESEIQAKYKDDFDLNSIGMYSCVSGKTDNNGNPVFVARLQIDGKTNRPNPNHLNRDYLVYSISGDDFNELYEMLKNSIGDQKPIIEESELSYDVIISNPEYYYIRETYRKEDDYLYDISMGFQEKFLKNPDNKEIITKILDMMEKGTIIKFNKRREDNSMTK